MKAARIHRFGPPEVIIIDEIPRPTPGVGEVLVRTAAAGVGPWDALIREKKSVVDVPLPLILGSDLAGVIESVGPGIQGLQPGDEVYGVTNKNFCGAYAEYALASAYGIAPRPKALRFTAAASAPVVAVTAWQMLFDYAKVKPGQTVLIHGAAGNVGASAVQLAKRAGLQIFATAGPADLDYVKALGAGTVINYRTERFEKLVPSLDAVLDLVGGETRDRSFSLLKPDGILVSMVSPPPGTAQLTSPNFVFFLVNVTTARLNNIGELFDRGELVADVGTVLPLEQAHRAHEMLGGAPHSRGKIVLTTQNFN